VHYRETYLLVVRWTSIRLLLVLSIIHGWSVRFCDGLSPSRYPWLMCTLKYQRGLNLRGAETQWNQPLVKGLKELGFKQSMAGMCVFYRGTTVFMAYVDDRILINPDHTKILKAMLDMQPRFSVQDKGKKLSDYLGVKVQMVP
jgi:Reverse transcriptase (RNA-dependent DNA polymerase)